MNQKIRNIILLVLHTITTTMLFLPFMYYHDFGWRTGIYGDRIYVKQQLSFNRLISGYELAEWTESVALVIMILFFIVFIALFLQLIGKNNRQQNSVITLILAIGNLFGFFWYSYFITKTIQPEGVSVELGELFYIELLLQAVFVIFYIFTYTRINGKSSDHNEAAGD